MPGLSFLNAWMLAGLAALAIPVLIHLLLRRKKKRLRFSTLRFFQQHDEQSSQRRKLRHWLLLGLRLLLVALLVLAFARPFRSRSGAGAAAARPRQAVLVVDRSASMQAIGTDGPRWTRAKERLQKVLAGLGPDDRVALVGCARRAEVVTGFSPPAVIARALETLQPSFETSNLGEGLQQAVRLVALGDPAATSTIYVVSDLQRTACQSLGSGSIPLDVDVQLLAVGDRVSPNLALTQLEAGDLSGTRPHVAVESFSDEDVRDARLEIAVDGKGAVAVPITLKSGAATNLEFSLPVLAPGWHELTASLRGRDALELDNTRHAVTFVPEPMRVVLVEGRKPGRVFEEEMFFVGVALDPGRSGTNAVATPYRVTTIAPAELAGKLGSPRGARPCDLVILPGLRDFPSGCGAALRAFVQAGGGLLLFLGDELSANRYNAEFRDLLPAELGAGDAATEPGAGWRIGDYDTNNVAFGAFGRPHAGDLRIPEFTHRVLVTPAKDASVLARFDDGLPFLATRRVGGGRVALANTSADTRWGDWPKHKTFVPWLHGLGRYLVPEAGPGQSPDTRGFVVGENIDLAMASDARGARLMLHAPAGKDRPVVTDDQGRLRDLDASAPGIYSLRTPEGREVQRLAVNLPPQESDLATLTPLEVQNQLVRVPAERKPTLVAELFGPKKNHQEYWALLLLAVLGLLFLETVWANRTSA